MLLHSSTRQFFKESWRATRSLLSGLHGYVYLRWPVTYIGMFIGVTPFGKLWARLLVFLPNSWLKGKSKTFADGYHAKVMPPGTVRQLLQVDRNITALVPEQVLPYAHARQLILEEGQAVALLDCPCRLARPVHCEPVDVCILVGNAVVDFAVTHHPERCRRVTPQHAVDVVQRCNEAGLVSHAFFKAAVMERFYAICNCCTCCCGAMQGHANGMPLLAASGYMPQVTTSACRLCGQCAKRCPFSAIRMQHETGWGLPHIDVSRCMGCGICVLVCPSHALTLCKAGALVPLEVPVARSLEVASATGKNA